jgi:aminopeptidase
LTDIRTEKLARLCVQYSADVKSNEQVIIEGSHKALPLINELYKECLLRDAHPFVLPNLDLQYTFFKHAKEHQLAFTSPIQKFIAENADVTIGIFCEPSPKGLSTIDPSKTRIRAASRKELTQVYPTR